MYITYEHIHNAKKETVYFEGETFADVVHFLCSISDKYIYVYEDGDNLANTPGPSDVDNYQGEGWYDESRELVVPKNFTDDRFEYSDYYYRPATEEEIKEIEDKLT